MDIIKGMLILIHTIGWIGALTCENTYSHNVRFQVFMAMAIITLPLFILITIFE